MKPIPVKAINESASTVSFYYHKNNFSTLAHKLGKEFEARAAKYDDTDAFVYENYEALKTFRVFSAMIPQELGGGGVSHSQMGEFLRIMGYYDGSTGLALSMHQHLIAATVWKYRNGNGGEALLKKVADEQIVLVSTGAKDWLESNGELIKVEGGYEVTATKIFASQSVAGDMLMTSSRYHDPVEGNLVLHFPVPFSAKGVKVLNDWKTLGMRGTGSHTVQLDKVFVPESAIAVKRKQGELNHVWNIILTVAMPLIMAVYTGIAEKAAQMAIDKSKASKIKKEHITLTLGEMHNQLTLAQVLLKDMFAITNDLDFTPNHEMGNAILTRKTLVANACINTVNKAMEVIGGQSFFRGFGLERLFRDVQAAVFHPLPEKEQQLFSGKYILNEPA